MKINTAFSDYDKVALKILDGFLPDKIFDAHTHIFDKKFVPNWSIGEHFDVDDYKKLMLPGLCNPKVFRANIITTPDKTMGDSKTGNRDAGDRFMEQQLEKAPEFVGEIMVSPEETAEDIEKRLIHPNIRGFKCYHLLAPRKDTFNAETGEFLPESAWEVANKYKMCITLHMVKDDALADESNQKYICEMAERYPDATLILAHAARSFASWTAVESIEKIAHLDNVWYDFSAVCESPAMIQIMKKAGTDKCMWGSDGPVCFVSGKAISVGSGFHWMYGEEYEDNKAKPDKFWSVLFENLMAVRQACIIADIPESKVEDLFFNNAERLWKK